MQPDMDLGCYGVLAPWTDPSESEERESAMSFLLPSICSALKQKLNLRVRRVKWRTRSITLGIRYLCVNNTDTDSLSQKNWMRLFEKKLANRWQNQTILAMQWRSLADLVFFYGVSYEPWNQWVWKMPPNPREPEASVYRDNTSEMTQWEGIKKDLPHCSCI